MIPQERVEAFCQIVNTWLARRADHTIVFEELSRAANDDDERELAKRIYDNFLQAVAPTRFYEQRISEDGPQFEQSYDLLALTFDETELDSRERYRAAVQDGHGADDDSPLILIRRFWRVQGAQTYATDGQLAHFRYEPLSLTESIASVVTGNYMAMCGPAGEQGGIGTLGNIGTRSALRGSHGHGTALVQAFERAVASAASAHEQPVRIILLESQNTSKGFWLKQGYRWPVGSHYAQPPLEFDPTTGERIHDEVPEMLMVKIPGEENPTSVSASLLSDAVYTMYYNWCYRSALAFPPAARQRVEDYVFGKVFANLTASIASHGATVPLTADLPDQVPV